MSGNPKFTTEDCVRIQRHLKITKATQEGMTITQAYDIAVATRKDKSLQGCPRGYQVKGEGNQIVPIPGAYTYVDGKPVVAFPLDTKPEPRRRKIRPVDIESLCEADGRVDEAECHDDDPRELSLIEPGPVAVQDDEATLGEIEGEFVEVSDGDSDSD